MGARQAENTKDATGSSSRKSSSRKKALAGADNISERLQRLESDLHALKRDLAGRFEPESLPHDELGLLVCRVGDAQIAFLQDVVREVVQAPRLTPLLETPCWVPGLLNLRGSFIPVIDVQARVAGEPRRIELTDYIVVADVEGRPVGFLVQEILDLRRIVGDRIDRPRDVPFATYLMGAIHKDGKAVLVLSAVALTRLSDLPEAL
jgi:purine-binding chemotaxis protein CheW